MWGYLGLKKKKEWKQGTNASSLTLSQKQITV